MLASLFGKKKQSSAPVKPDALETLMKLTEQYERVEKRQKVLDVQINELN